MARILIVEDEGILAIKTRVDLEEMGHKVVAVVDNAAEAIRVAKGEKPDIILMDIVLKGRLNGIEASGVICAGNGCKIIYMTAHADDITVEAAKRTRHVGFLFKPFEPYQLKEVINEALGG